MPPNQQKPSSQQGSRKAKKSPSSFFIISLGLIVFFFIFFSDLNSVNVKQLTYSEFISYTDGLYKIEPVNQEKASKESEESLSSASIIAELIKENEKEKVFKELNTNKMITITSSQEEYKVSLYRKITKVNVRSKDMVDGSFITDTGATQSFVTAIPKNTFVLDMLPKKGVDVKVVAQEKNGGIFNALIGLLPWILMIFFIWFFFIRQINNSNNKAFSFGKSKARLYESESGQKITFNDIAGYSDAKQELSEVIDFLKAPEKYIKMGAKIPKGILLSGPPGTGKTLLARAVAGEANRPFFSISASEFVEMFVGVGASRVRDLFNLAKKNSPCIIFIDEIDSVGRVRGIGTGGGNDEKEQTLNQILSEMDGFEKESTIIVLAATNRPDVLDSALLRPGRFDRQVQIGIPSESDRLAILKHHIKNKPISSSIDLEKLSKSISGFSGAEIANLVNEAILIATRKNKSHVEDEDFKEAQTKSIKQKNNNSTEPPTLFGRNKAKFIDQAHESTVKFSDVAGVYEAKEELTEIVDFLKNPTKYTDLGARIPKGVLLTGPPGTGKTLLAKAVAGEANRPFFSTSGSEFVEMYVGVGASRVRDLFNNARKNAPCIIFIDEIDAIGKKRSGGGQFGGNSEQDQTLNQILVEMDGFGSNETVIVLASTNRGDMLDPALLRPGRFDRQVSVEKPDVRAREEILKVHAKNKPLVEEVDLRSIAQGTAGFSGAELENLLNEAALFAAKENRKEINENDIEEAKDKVLMGPEKRNIIMLQKEKINTAFHESGHAIVAHYLKETDPVHKVTIIPRGMALGVTQQIPIEDKKGYSKQYILNRLAVLMAGRIAEEMKFGSDSITTGASHDFEVATQTAQNFVARLGMSDKIGHVSYDLSQYPSSTFSQETAREIDIEVRRVIEEQYKVAYELLKNHEDKLIKMSEMLLEQETIDGKDVEELLGKKPGVEEIKAEVELEYQKIIDRQKAKQEKESKEGEKKEPSDNGSQLDIEL